MTGQVTEKKSFGMALLVWVFFAGLGGHRVYITEKASYLLWYWLVTIVTFGIAPLVDVFFIKSLIQKANEQ